ncbi:hypothetical protein SmJEL517_g04284 [Synchytrium microbalum]|uniref:Chromatin assembly factor 1 subunit A dimerization domain-containing protein n=1 Tax=Synchytrium microbalum TaxID=1806994 RepID=A0A507C3I0_9FUNG|nr:uncharacterized protein SmJEL517_g04284 [Synchytrium microbalum]TPX32654.1 hypothetical protein SmJEL517_g04284 [Synchytrium microbalum]
MATDETVIVVSDEDTPKQAAPEATITIDGNGDIDMQHGEQIRFVNVEAQPYLDLFPLIVNQDGQPDKKKRKDSPTDKDDAPTSEATPKSTQNLRKKAKTGHDAPQAALVSLKKNKVVFNEKKLDLSSHPSTAADIVAFHELKKTQKTKLDAFPAQCHPLLAKLVQDSELTVASLATNIHKKLCEFDADGAEPILSAGQIKKEISVIATRTNYGMEKDGVAIANLAIYRWEVNDLDLLGDLRDTIVPRRAVRVEAKEALRTLIAAMPQGEQDLLFVTKPKKGAAAAAASVATSSSSTAASSSTTPAAATKAAPLVPAAAAEAAGAESSSVIAASSSAAVVETLSVAAATVSLTPTESAPADVVSSSAPESTPIILEDDPVVELDEPHALTSKSAEPAKSTKKTPGKKKRKAAEIAQEEPVDESGAGPSGSDPAGDAEASPAKVNVAKADAEFKPEPKKAKAAPTKKSKDAPAKKGQTTLASFFTPGPKKDTPKPVKPDAASVVQAVIPFVPFHVKEHVFVAPYNWYEGPVGKGFMASLFSKEYELSITDVKKELRPPQISFKKTAQTPKEDPVVMNLFDVDASITEGDPLSKIRGLHWKLLQFHEDTRPAYWGTWSKKSKSVGRRPFTKVDILDYENDSEAEWEQDEDGEECRSDEEEEDDLASEAGSQVSEEGWLVPDGHLSDDEGATDERIPSTAEAAPTKRKLEPLVPVIIGLFFEGADDSPCHALLKECQYFAYNGNFPIDPYEVPLDDPIDWSEASKWKGKPTFTDEILRLMAPIVQGNASKLSVQVEEIRKQAPDLPLSNSALEKKIKELTEREQRTGDAKVKYYLKPEYEYLLRRVIASPKRYHQTKLVASPKKPPPPPEDELVRLLKDSPTNPNPCISRLDRIIRGGDIPEIVAVPELLNVASWNKNTILREKCMQTLRMHVETIDRLLSKCRASNEPKAMMNEFRKPWLAMLANKDFLLCIENNLASNDTPRRRVMCETMKLLQSLMTTSDQVCQAKVPDLKKTISEQWLQSLMTPLTQNRWSDVATECVKVIHILRQDLGHDAMPGMADTLLSQMKRNVPENCKSLVLDIFKVCLSNDNVQFDDATIARLHSVLQI